MPSSAAPKRSACRPPNSMRASARTRCATKRSCRKSASPRNDGLVFVIPAKPAPERLSPGAGIQNVLELDPGLRRGDEFSGTVLIRLKHPVQHRFVRKRVSRIYFAASRLVARQPRVIDV